MLSLIFSGLTALVSFVFRYFPGPRLLVRLRQRDGLKWGVPAMLVAVPYLLVAATCVQIIKDGGPSALYLIVLWCLIMAIAFVVNGPISVILLVSARVREARTHTVRQPARRAR